MLPPPSILQVSIATSTQKNVPIYNVKITVTPKGSGSSPKKAQSQTIELDRSFTGWFDVQGHFIALPFQTMLATAVPAIGRADPKRVAAAAASPSEAAGSASSELLEADAATLDALLASSEATGADAAGATAAGKKTKRRKA